MTTYDYGSDQQTRDRLSVYRERLLAQLAFERQGPTGEDHAGMSLLRNESWLIEELERIETRMHALRHFGDQEVSHGA